MPALSIRNISKVFGSAKVLADVSLDIMPGEVHGLLGQNGSGKSTLIKVLAGFHAPEPGGELTVDGVDCPLPLPVGRARELGISFVHQHLGLIPSLTVLENMLVGEFAEQTFAAVSWSRSRARVRSAFERFGLSIDPDQRVADLSQADRALVAIVRAFEEVTGAGGTGVLILDEPTPFLPRAGVDQLFELVRGVVAQGVAVIFVSHDIDEVFEITDRVSVLRDGHLVGSVVTAQSNPDELVDMIVGRKVEYFKAADRDLSGRPIAAELRDASDEIVSGVSFSIRSGEVVGLTGLIGSGFDRIPALIYGASRAHRGELQVAGHNLPLARMRPATALAAGIALLPADRLGAAGFGNLSVRENVTLPLLSSSIFIDWRQLDSAARRLGTQFEVRPNDPSLPLSALSGGNAQKALLGKWFQTRPALMLLEEPVQGVDVGARQRILSAISAAADEGMAVIVASSDSEILAQICDRVLVFAKGAVVSTLTGERLAKAAIAEACLLSTANSQLLGTSGSLN